jgi:hypothetical protein
MEMVCKIIYRRFFPYEAGTGYVWNAIGSNRGCWCSWGNLNMSPKLKLELSKFKDCVLLLLDNYPMKLFMFRRLKSEVVYQFADLSLMDKATHLPRTQAIGLQRWLKAWYYHAHLSKICFEWNCQYNSCYTLQHVSKVNPDSILGSALSSGLTSSKN